MTNVNKTSILEYRLLTDIDKETVHTANLEAFSDYVIPLQPTADQFENHLAQNAVNFDVSVGAFVKNKLVAYWLTGVGNWNGRKTAYNAGTGVIREFRKQRIATSMFEFLSPKLKALRFEQLLLEVISNNTNAINLYEKLGFERSRKLLFFEQTEEIPTEATLNLDIRKIQKKHWTQIKPFGSGIPSWQFSFESLSRAKNPPEFFDAFIDEKCVGYGSVFPTSGLIPHISIDREYQSKGIGSAMLNFLAKQTRNSKKLKFSNLDSDISDVVTLLKKLNFKPTISQYEMIKQL